MKFNCAYCRREAQRPAGHINRSLARGDKVYCSRLCSGYGRRKHKSKAQKVEEKRVYDMEYRQRNMERLTQAKREYHKRTYDPAKEAFKRKAKMPRHVEYCRQPAYRAYKAQYDREYRAKKEYGEFWECSLLAEDIRNEALKRMTDYEIRLTKGTLNKCLQRKRAFARSQRAEPEVGTLDNLERGQRR